MYFASPNLPNFVYSNVVLTEVEKIGTQKSSDSLLLSFPSGPDQLRIFLSKLTGKSLFSVVEIYSRELTFSSLLSLRYQLSILTDIEETQQCPMNRRKVLHVPLKTFALGRRSSSLQSDSLSCSVYQIAESHGRPAEVVVYSATPGPIGRFSIAQQDITAVEVSSFLRLASFIFY